MGFKKLNSYRFLYDVDRDCMTFGTPMKRNKTSSHANRHAAGKHALKRAVALKYEAAKDHAPRMTAKGNGLMAERIVELARKEGIPLQEDPNLVGALMQLDFQDEIPAELYQAVAEILAFAYRLNRSLGQKD